MKFIATRGLAIGLLLAGLGGCVDGPTDQHQPMPGNGREFREDLANTQVHASLAEMTINDLDLYSPSLGQGIKVTVTVQAVKVDFPYRLMMRSGLENWFVGVMAVPVMMSVIVGLRYTPDYLNGLPVPPGFTVTGYDTELVERGRPWTYPDDFGGFIDPEHLAYRPLDEDPASPSTSRPTTGPATQGSAPLVMDFSPQPTTQPADYHWEPVTWASFLRFYEKMDQVYGLDKSLWAGAATQPATTQPVARQAATTEAGDGQNPEAAGDGNPVLTK